jgi:hypothetical protein
MLALKLLESECVNVWMGFMTAFCMPFSMQRTSARKPTEKGFIRPKKFEDI